MGKRFASFYHCLAFARFWEVNFWRSFIKCQYFNDGWTDFHKNIYLYIFIFGFFRKPEKLGSHTGSKWRPGKRWPRWPIDPVTQWPSSMSDRQTHTGSVQYSVECGSVCWWVMKLRKDERMMAHVTSVNASPMTSHIYVSVSDGYLLSVRWSETILRALRLVRRRCETDKTRNRIATGRMVGTPRHVADLCGKSTVGWHETVLWEQWPRKPTRHARL